MPGVVTRCCNPFEIVEHDWKAQVTPIGSELRQKFPQIGDYLCESCRKKLYEDGAVAEISLIHRHSEDLEVSAERRLVRAAFARRRVIPNYEDNGGGFARFVVRAEPQPPNENQMLPPEE